MSYETKKSTRNKRLMRNIMRARNNRMRNIMRTRPREREREPGVHVAVL